MRQVSIRAGFAIMAVAIVACHFQNANAQGQQTSEQAFADSIVDAAEEYRSRIADTCRYGDWNDFVDSVRATESSIKASEPVLKNEWITLVIGEFEPQATFDQRQLAAKEREQREFEAAHRDWERRRDAFVKDIEKKSKEVEKAIKEFERAKWEWPRLPNYRRTSSHKEIPLPLFDRKSMSFGPLVIPPFVSTLPSTRPGKVLARLEDATKTTIRISLPSLEAAQSFKERFSRGEITCALTEELELLDSETPIVVKPEVTKLVEVSQPLTAENYFELAAGLINIIYVANGGTPPPPDPFAHTPAPSAPVYERVVVTPAVTEVGTQHRFTMSPVAIVFIDKAGRPVKEVSVTILNTHPEVEAVTPDAQAGVRVLRQGDLIVRIGDCDVHDIRAVQSAVRKFKAGQTYDVSFRRPGTKDDLHLKAEGGKPLGVAFRLP